MKKILFLVAFLSATFISVRAQSEHYYYYYQGEKIYLDLDLKRISVNSFAEDTTFLSRILSDNFSVSNVVPQYGTNPIIYYFEIEFENSLIETNYYSVINSLNAHPNTKKASPTYMVSGSKLGLSNNFYVKLKKTTDITILEQYVKNFGLEIPRQDKYMPLWYVIGSSKEHENSLKLSNIFYESGLFETAEPELIYHDISLNGNPLSNDPFFGDQWGLKNTGQYGSAYAGIDIKVEETWTISTGNGVKIAIYDHGFEMDHPDLQANVYGTGFDATSGTSPSVVRGFHGTPCAGITGAVQNNDIGISGVAPNTSLTSISISLLFSDTPQQIASGFNWAVENEMDVISNSWGGYAPSLIITDAISNALNNGRNGKGCVVVFASGNENNTSVRYPGNAFSDILVVGAMSPCGERKNPNSCDGETNWGSCYGNLLDVVAPGVKMPTTDRQGENGQNPIEEENPAYFDHKDYFSSFNGTSSACPVVAGVTALILSVNPCLTGKQVRDIIEQTAQKVGNYSYTNNSNRPNGTWNNEMGYGLVNAYAAVQMAQQIETGNLVDLYIRDTPEDLGIEPNTVSQYSWTSEDIWIRNQNDGIEEHQNPEYHPTNPNYIYVRVNNRGCQTSLGDEKLSLFWAKASPSLSWDYSWNEENTFENGLPVGGKITTIDIPPVAPNESIVVAVPWENIPNPSDYDDINQTMNEMYWHFCLLAQVEADNDPITDTEPISQSAYVRNNNNVAQKNITIVDLVPNSNGKALISGVIAVGNVLDTPKCYSLEFITDRNEIGKKITEEAEISIELDNTLQTIWENGGSYKQNIISQHKDNKLIVRGDKAILGNFCFRNRQDIGTLNLKFNFLTQEVSEKQKYTYHVIQRDENGEIIGGETYEIRKPPRPLFYANAHNIQADKNEIVTLSAELISEPAIYNWYDIQGNFVCEGMSFTTLVTDFQKYKLEVIALSDGYKDYTEAKIELKPNRIETFYPNPTSNLVNVNYKINQGETAHLKIMKIYPATIVGITSNNYILDVNNNTKTLNLTNYSYGLYKVILVVDGQISDTKTLIKN